MTSASLRTCTVSALRAICHFAASDQGIAATLSCYEHCCSNIFVASSLHTGFLKPWQMPNREESYLQEEALGGPLSTLWKHCLVTISILSNLRNRKSYGMELVYVSNFWLAWQFPYSLASVGFLWLSALPISRAPLSLCMSQLKGTGSVEPSWTHIPDLPGQGTG